MARLTVVTQRCPRVLDDELATLAAERGVALHEVALAGAVGAARARHVGAAEGDEEFVGFLDDDIRFDAGSLSALVTTCTGGGWGGACGVLSVPDVSTVAALAKSVFFRSIFRDPRPLAAGRRRPVASNLLSGGMSVYRRDLYDRCAHAWLDSSPDARGEDVELSYAVSRLAPLAVDPSVRVQNLSGQNVEDGSDATARGMRNLARYRDFAIHHASSPRHRLSYCLVLVGVAVRWLAAGAGRPFARAVLCEAKQALRRKAPYR